MLFLINPLESYICYSCSVPGIVYTVVKEKTESLPLESIGFAEEAGTPVGRLFSMVDAPKGRCSTHPQAMPMAGSSLHTGRELAPALLLLVMALRRPGRGQPARHRGHALGPRGPR